MSLFYSPNVVSIGGKKRRSVVRVSSDSWDELVQFNERYPGFSVLVQPERGLKSYKSRRLPSLSVDQDQLALLDQVGAEKVSSYHLRVLTWLLREEIYVRRQKPTPEVIKFFQTGIRGSLRELLQAGAWVDSPESPELKNLNSKLEKIDLVRRSNLKFSSDQGTEKLFYKEKEEYERQTAEFGDPDAEYRNGSPAERERLRTERPWMASKWIEVFGE